MDRLQSVLNALARLVYNSRKYDRITPLLRDLHWLRVPGRIQFCLAVLVFRCRNQTALEGFFARDLQWTDDNISRRRLRSATTHKLVLLRTRLRTIGDRAFGAAAPRVWNNLPTDIITAPSVATFKQRLKTLLKAVSLAFTANKIWQAVWCRTLANTTKTTHVYHWLTVLS